MVRRTIIEIGMVLVAALGLGLATKAIHPQAPAWTVVQAPLGDGEILFETIQTDFDGDVLWVDARTAEHFERGHIPGAILINPQDADNLFFAHMDAIQMETRPIVIYCNSQACESSKKIAEYLAFDIGLPHDIFVLKGGWPEWQRLNR